MTEKSYKIRQTIIAYFHLHLDQGTPRECMEWLWDYTMTVPDPLITSILKTRGAPDPINNFTCIHVCVIV